MVGALPPDEHVSMIIYRAVGTKLISKDMALEIAIAVLRHNYGEQRLEEQLPLTISETPGIWIIHGSKPHKSSKEQYEQIAKSGKYQIEISQFDGRILKLMF